MITFVTAGYPSVDFTVEVIKRMFDAGSDVVELGVPFSDPLADGPVIQNANTQAILSGMKTRDVFEAVSRVSLKATPILWSCLSTSTPSIGTA